MEERRVAIYARPLFLLVSECKVRAFYGFGGDKKCLMLSVECWMLNEASAIEPVRQINIQHSTFNIPQIIQHSPNHSTFFNDYHKILGDGGDSITDTTPDF